jgi:hypothetical protein
MASDRKLWDKAREVISALQSDEEWLSLWSFPAKKTAVLARMLEEINSAKKECD